MIPRVSLIYLIVFFFSLEPGISLSPFSSVAPADTSSHVGPSSSMDLDTNRPEQFGLDDSHRPTVEDSKLIIY